MIKPNLKNRKIKRKIGFRPYFTIFVSANLCIAVICGIVLKNLTQTWIFENLHIPDFVVVIIFSLIIGAITAWFIAKFVFSPIKHIRDAMTEVSEGNFDTSVNEESRFAEIEEINQAFNIMVKELRSTEVIQSDFVSNVSHEFKTPLSAIEGYTIMLQADDLTEEERKEYTNKILFNTKRMSDLVQNILLLSKLDNQGIEREEEFSVDEQIRQEILATETKWSEKNLDLDVQLEPIRYFGNGAIISHVWSNLIGNAIKFSPNGGKISLELKKVNGAFLFSVSDEGNGIEENQKQYIFNKFYQADSSHKQKGNGLGLAIVKKIVEMYDGKVEVENITPSGCKFIVQLPIK